MSKAQVELIERAFGDLRWDAEYQWWCCEKRHPSGKAFQVVVNNGAFGPRRRRFERAARLFLRAMESESLILRDAVRRGPLDSLNALSQQSAKPELSADELIDHLRLEFVGLYWEVPITINYNADMVVDGRRVRLTLDEDLQVVTAKLWPDNFLPRTLTGSQLPSHESA